MFNETLEYDIYGGKMITANGLNMNVHWKNKKITIISNIDRKEETKVTCETKANTVNSSYFIIGLPTGVDHCFWFDKGSGVAPVISTIDAANIHKVDITAKTTAAEVATTLATVIASVTGFDATATLAVVTITAENNGPCAGPVISSNWAATSTVSVSKGGAKVGSIIYENELPENVYEILDINIEDTTLADLTAFVIEKNLVESGNYGNRTWQAVTNYDTKRIVLSNAVAL